MADIKCTDSVVLRFSASYIVPAPYGLEDATQFSIAVSTNGLSVYKDVIDYKASSITGPCDTVLSDVSLKLGQVKVSGVITYRIAANGIQSNPIVVSPTLDGTVNVGGNMWSSADGFVEVKDGENNYMTVGFILPDQELDPEMLTVTLKSLELDATYEDEKTGNRTVYLDGQFELSYGLV